MGRAGNPRFKADYFGVGKPAPPRRDQRRELLRQGREMSNAGGPGKQQGKTPQLKRAVEGATFNGEAGRRGASDTLRE